MKKGINKDFIRINFVVKPLLNEFSNKINKKNAKKLTLESSSIYKENQKMSADFISNWFLEHRKNIRREFYKKCLFFKNRRNC